MGKFWNIYFELLKIYPFWSYQKGTGQGLVINTAIINLKEHFESNPSLSFGLSFTVTALGGIITPKIDAWLLSIMSGK